MGNWFALLSIRVLSNYEARNQDSRFVFAMIIAACAMPDARHRG